MKQKEHAEAACDAANDMLKRMQKAAFQLDTLDRKLSRQLTPPELAGAHIFRSIDVLIKAGLSFEETMERHRGMAEVAMEVRGRQLRSARQN